MILKEKFAEIFQVPPAMQPHIDLLVEEGEMELVVRLSEREMTASEIAEHLGMTQEETARFLENAYYREIVNRETKDGVTTYSPATFYQRMNVVAMFENWGDVPAEAREAAIEWQLREFVDKWLPVVEEMRADPNAYYKIPNRDVLLLEEALEQVEAADEHVIAPCDCRAIVMACDRPLDVCIRLDEGARLTQERGQGRRVTKEECKAIVIDADRAGLMHTGLRDWQGRELFGFCNCCACDCYPFRAAKMLDMERQWPRSHYVARRDLDKCIHCGICIKRCYFDAFYRDGSKIEVGEKMRKAVKFDAESCWGCGICATACPEEAIEMISLASEE